MENYYWSTEECLYTNTETMQDFIENHLLDKFDADVIFSNGSYIEFSIDGGDVKYAARASGDGDCKNHVIEFEELSEDLITPEEGVLYKHFKGGLYTVLHIAFDTEEEEKTVVYRSVTDGKIFTRLLRNWSEEVYYENALVQRFKKYGEI